MQVRYFRWLAGILIFLIIGTNIGYSEGEERCEFVFVRLKYKIPCKTHPDDWNAKAEGKANDIENLIREINKETTLKVAKTPRILSLADKDIFNYPFLFMTGHHSFTFNENERINLTEHLEKGGFLFAVACCGNECFSNGFENEMRNIFPNNELKKLPQGHPVFNLFYKIEKIRYGTTLEQNKEKKYSENIDYPSLKGIDIDGRLVAVLSPYGLTCGWAGWRECGGTGIGNLDYRCRRIQPEDAIRMGINVILYALSH